jgi:hypothetical protein
MSTSLAFPKGEMPAPHPVERLLSRVGSRLTPDFLPNFGIQRQPERESSCRYYLVQATPRGLTLRKTGLVVRLETATGEDLYATVRQFDQRLLDQLCWIVITTHEGEAWFHRHVLRLWPINVLPPGPRRASRPVASPDLPGDDDVQVPVRRRLRRAWENWRSLPARHILAAEGLT